MRALVLWLVAALFAAGCSAPASNPPTQSGTAAPDPTAILSGPTVPADPSAHRVYTVDAANLTFDHALSVFTLTALANDVPVYVNWTGSWPAVTTSGDCLLGRLAGPGGNASAALALWSSRSSTRVDVRAAGMSVGADTIPTTPTGSGVIRFDGGGHYLLKAGETVTFEVGGSGNAVYRYAGTHADSRTTIAVTGAHRTDTRAGPRLACGIGARDAGNSTAGASFFVADAEAGGDVALVSTHGSTLWAVGASNLAGMDQVHADFLDRHVPVTGKILLASAQPGRMAVVFDQSADVGGTAWAFLDEGWTEFSSGSSNAATASTSAAWVAVATPGHAAAPDRTVAWSPSVAEPWTPATQG